jgi:hypothetical protein
VASPGGQISWSPTTLASLLSNPAYRGEALFHSGGFRSDADARPEAIAVAVPALVNETLFTAAQEQLGNRRRYR